MASLTEHVMINKLGDDLDNAITFVGGDTSSISNIMEYPQIIREQLSAGGSVNLTELILEGDSAIIIADETGRDEYNTKYATGIKTGLNPGAYYIRICTAIKNIEPVYIDLTPVTDLIQGGGESMDINTIINKVIESPEIKVAINKEVQSQVNSLLINYVTKDDLKDLELGVSENRVNEIINQKFSEVNIDISTIENITNDIFDINQTLKNKVNQSQVEQIVIETMASNANNEGIDIEELNW